MQYSGDFVVTPSFGTVVKGFAIISLAVASGNAQSQPTLAEYANCSGILTIASAVTKADEPDESKRYIKNAESLQIKASKLKGYDKKVYLVASFESSGTYIEMVKNGSASGMDFWSDVGYCRGLAK